MASEFVSSWAMGWDSGAASTLAIDVSTGSGRTIYAAVAWSGTGSVNSVSSNPNGAFTAVTGAKVTTATGGRTQGVDWFYFANPDTGVHTISVGQTGTVDVRSFSVVQVNGTNATSTFSTPVTVTTLTVNYTHDITGTATNTIVLSAANAGDPGNLGLTDITDGTLLWESNETGFWNTTHLGGYKSGSATSTQIIYTLDNEGNAVSGFGVPSGAVAEAVVTGTATASINETDVVTGGKTVIVTVSNETYVQNSTVPVSFGVSNTLNSGNNTASTLWFVSTQGVSTNDLVIWHIGWDDSTTVTACTASTAPSGQAISTLMGPVASLNTEVRSQVYWVIATTSWAASTTAFTPSATESWTATVLRIPAGAFNSSSPFGSKSTYNANTSTGTAVSSPSFSATTSDAIGLLVAFPVIDTDPITGTPAGWQSTNALDLGAVAHGLAYRTSTVAASESIPTYSWTIAGDSSVTHAYILNAYADNAFDDARQDFINNVDSAQSEGTGWDAVVKAGQHVSTVVRTSDTVITMTLSAWASYNISAQETITVSVPGSIVTGGTPILATPTFTIATVGGGGGTFFMHDKLLLLGVS